MIALERLSVDEQARSVRYRPKGIQGGDEEQTFEMGEFLARLLQHLPEPRFHQVRYYGFCPWGGASRFANLLNSASCHSAGA